MPQNLWNYAEYCAVSVVDMSPNDLAEAILYLAGLQSAKTTGGVLTVDGGNPTAYVR